MMMRKLLWLVLVLIPTWGWGADRYIWNGATGTGDGSSWTNAYTDMPATGACAPGGHTWARGIIYWIAGSDTAYSGACFRNQTGTGVITLKKAEPANHGTETGWDAAFGTKQAVIAGSVGTYISNITLDGSYRTTPESGHGIKIVNAGTFGVWTPNNKVVTGVSVQYVEITHSTTTGTGAAIKLWGDGGNNVSFSYMHDLAGLCVHTARDGTYNATSGMENMVFKNNVCGRIGLNAGTGHYELMKDDGQGDNAVIKNNLFYDWYSTGGIVLGNGNSGWKIYNNVFTQRTAGLGCGNGVITGLTAGGGYTNNLVYNNTFANIASSCGNIFAAFGDFTGGGNEVKNNLFYNVAELSAIGSTGVTKGTNWFSGCASYTPSGTEIAGTGDPFVSSSTGNYNLSSGASTVINAGEDLGTSYNLDIVEAFRPVGAWDIGAYEYVAGGADETPPVMSAPLPSGAQACISDPHNVMLTLTTDEAATCKYSTSDEAYAAMPNTYTTTGVSGHYESAASLACGAAYTYYSRCSDGTNINTSSATTSFSIAAADVTAPEITSFVIPATASTIYVPITTFDSTDAVGVTGWCITLTNDNTTCEWLVSQPTTFLVSSAGAKTFYAFVRDAAGNISTGASDAVTVTLTGIGGGATVKIGTGATVKFPALGGVDYVVDAGCQLALYMNNNGGNETDRSVNAYTMTQTSGVIPTVSNVPNTYAGVSRDFEAGDSEYLSCISANCPNLNINGADAKLSLVAWINNESIANAAGQNVISKYVTVGNQRQYVLEIVGTNTNTFKVYCEVSSNGAAGTIVYSATTNYASGTWYHIGCVANDTDVRVYVNGVLDSTPGAHTAGIFNATSPVNIGAYSVSVNLYDGLIDEVGIFNRELTSTEILDIYTYGISGNRGGND
jgi:hypothetical protein